MRESQLVEMHFGISFILLLLLDFFLLITNHLLTFLFIWSSIWLVPISNLDLQYDGDVISDGSLSLASLHCQVDLNNVTLLLLLLQRVVVLLRGAVGAVITAEVNGMSWKQVRYTVGCFTNLQRELANL